jgi:hypothetical protein
MREVPKFDKPADNVIKRTRSTTAHFESYKSFEQNTMKGLPLWDPNKIEGGGGTVEGQTLRKFRFQSLKDHFTM